MSRIGILITIALGGAIGTLARYGLSQWLQASPPRTFPVATLAANLIGCLVIGFCDVWLDSRGTQLFRDFVRIGFLGGLTTFSSYCIESVSLMEKRQYGLAAANLFASVVGGLAAAAVGIVLAKLIFRSEGG